MTFLEKIVDFPFFTGDNHNSSIIKIKWDRIYHIKAYSVTIYNARLKLIKEIKYISTEVFPLILENFVVVFFDQYVRIYDMTKEEHKEIEFNEVVIDYCYGDGILYVVTGYASIIKINIKNGYKNQDDQKITFNFPNIMESIVDVTLISNGENEDKIYLITEDDTHCRKIYTYSLKTNEYNSISWITPDFCIIDKKNVYIVNSNMIYFIHLDDPRNKFFFEESTKITFFSNFLNDEFFLVGKHDGSLSIYKKDKDKLNLHFSTKQDFNLGAICYGKIYDPDHVYVYHLLGCLVYWDIKKGVALKRYKGFFHRPYSIFFDKNKRERYCEDQLMHVQTKDQLKLFLEVGSNIKFYEHFEEDKKIKVKKILSKLQQLQRIYNKTIDIGCVLKYVN